MKSIKESKAACAAGQTRMRGGLCVGGVLAVVSLACDSQKSHPVPQAPLPPGESILSIQDIGGKKVVTELRGNRSTPLNWNLPLNEEIGTTWGGEKLVGLDDGRTIFCGPSLQPNYSCWIVEGEEATRITEPVLAPNPSMVELAERRLGIASNGAWWAMNGPDLEFSLALDTAAQKIDLPTKGDVKRVAWAPKTDLFALVVSEGKKCDLAVVVRSTSDLVDRFPLSDCFVDFVWAPDGKRLGIVENASLTLWEAKGGRQNLTTQTKGPDGKDEYLSLVAFSPDSSRVLISSSRHQKMKHNAMAGVYSPVFESFVVDIKTRVWTRLPEIGGLAIWRLN